MNKKTFILAMLLINVICGILIAAALFFNMKNNDLKTRATTPVTAKVIDLQLRQSIKKVNKHKRIKYTEYPILEYQYNGNDYKYERHIGYNVGVYKIGKTINLMINPDNPSEVYDPEETGMMKFFIIFPLIIAIFIDSIFIFVYKHSDH